MSEIEARLLAFEDSNPGLQDLLLGPESVPQNQPPSEDLFVGGKSVDDVGMLLTQDTQPLLHLRVVGLRSLERLQGQVQLLDLQDGLSHRDERLPTFKVF